METRRCGFELPGSSFCVLINRRPESRWKCLRCVLRGPDYIKSALETQCNVSVGGAIDTDLVKPVEL